jgi:hypothetical protein
VKNSGSRATFHKSTGYRFILPAPLHFEQRILESPVPIEPSPWHSGQMISQSSSRSYFRDIEIYLAKYLINSISQEII